jgi:hypothetical protein
MAALTLRAYARLLDSCYTMQLRYNLAVPEALLAAFDLCLAGQLVGTGPAAVAALRADLQKLFKVRCWCQLYVGDLQRCLVLGRTVAHDMHCCT